MGTKNCLDILVAWIEQVVEVWGKGGGGGAAGRKIKLAMKGRERKCRKRRGRQSN